MRQANSKILMYIFQVNTHSQATGILYTTILLQVVRILVQMCSIAGNANYIWL